MREYCREKGSNAEFEKLDPKELDELLEFCLIFFNKKYYNWSITELA